MNVPGVSDVLAHILSEDEEDDLKDFSTPSENSPGWWDQVDGDFGDPWIHGGDWYNPVTHQLLHFGGAEESKEKDYMDVEVPEHVMAKIVARFHDPATDAEEDPDHKKWLLSREEHKIDQVADAYKVARAEFLNNRIPHDFYLFDVPDRIPSYLQRYEEPVRQQFGADYGWDEWPIYAKLLEIGRYAGFENFSEAFKMNKIEAQKFLSTTSRKLKL